VEETEADVIIHATFPRLAYTQVTMEMAGDRLLVQGKTPRKVPTAESWYANAKGKYELRICSAVLPCTVDLMHAKMIRKHDMVQITIPKKPPETLQRATEKGQEIG
jgi:HSP20 family molecular chaperone IbpA